MFRPIKSWLPYFNSVSPSIWHYTSVPKIPFCHLWINWWAWSKAQPSSQFPQSICIIIRFASAVSSSISRFKCSKVTKQQLCLICVISSCRVWPVWSGLAVCDQSWQCVICVLPVISCVCMWFVVTVNLHLILICDQSYPECDPCCQWWYFMIPCDQPFLCVIQSSNGDSIFPCVIHVPSGWWEQQWQ